MRTKNKIIILLIILITLGSLATWGIITVRNRLAARAERARLAAIAQNQKVEEVSITTIEGWTVREIATYLDTKKKLFAAEIFTKAVAGIDHFSFPILSSIPKKQGLEGYLFPDTYRIVKTATAKEVAEIMIQNFSDRTSPLLVNAQKTGDQYIIPGFESLTLEKGRKAGLTLHELVTLASIVEKEAGARGETASSPRLLEERKTIAGIFYNRLTIGQPLQSDATINYVTGGDRPSPTNEDLEVKSLYNTYQNAGLPPGPIDNPSLASLTAVLMPIKTEYFYFLHKQPSGEVVYSKTFEEHVKNKNKYLK